MFYTLGVCVCTMGITSQLRWFLSKSLSVNGKAEAYIHVVLTPEESSPQSFETLAMWKEGLLPVWSQWER